MADAIGKEYDMKKLIVLIIVIFISMACLSACENKGKENSMAEYKSGIYHDKNWNESIGSHKGVAIPDKETALEIAKAIFNGMEKSKDVQEYTPQSVFFDEQDEIWIVSFWKDTDKITLGGDCSIAMQKKDGKVLRIWYGE